MVIPNQKSSEARPPQAVLGRLLSVSPQTWRQDKGQPTVLVQTGPSIAINLPN